MEIINLTGIIDDIFLNCSGDITKFWAKELAKQCALEFGKQLLELAVDNGKIDIKYLKGFVTKEFEINVVNKQSILDTIKQVE